MTLPVFLMDRKPSDIPSEEDSNVIEFSEANAGQSCENTPAATETKQKAHDLDHFRWLNKHNWSENPEVNSFVESVYNKHFIGGHKNVRHKHLKVLLLNLFDASCDDPDLKIAVSLNKNDYVKNSPNNVLGISSCLIEIIHVLNSVGLIKLVKGFKNRKTGKGRYTRIWPTETLIQLFEKARFSPLDIGDPKNRQTVVLRDADKNELSYEDTEEIRNMRVVLESYNALLRRTFIDIPTLDEPRINNGKDKYGNPKITHISHRAKFVYRVFHRSSFDKGGRFYGPWWQNCPGNWRSKIYINDEPTIEIDYSGFHIVLLYAKEGIDYQDEVGGDPYQVEQLPFLTSEKHARDCAKMLLLIALNAKDEKSTYQAFRSGYETGRIEKSFKDEQLSELLTKLKTKHKPIAHHLASDAGIELMKLDGQISEYVIRKCTELKIPVLTVHDSFIVPARYKNDLMLAKIMIDALQMAAREILNGKQLEKIKFKVTAEEGEDTYKSPRYLKQFDEFNRKRTLHTALRDGKKSIIVST